jgi:hypothetical protein
MVHRLCDRAILLQHGEVYASGPTEATIEKYLFDAVKHDGVWLRPDRLPRPKEVFLTSARILDAEGRPTGIIASERAFSLVLDYEVARPMPSFEVGFQVKNGHGVVVFTSLDSDTTHWPERTRPPGKYRSHCRIPANLLSPGTYSVTFAAAIVNQQTFDSHADALAFEITDAGCVRMKRNDKREGVIMPVLAWQIETESTN